MESNENNDDSIILTLRKTHLYIAIALVMGFGGGLGVARLVLRPAPVVSPVLEQGVSQHTGVVPANTPIAAEQSSLIQVATEGRPYLGPEDAPVTIVEFTDYECPFCGRHFRETLPQLFTEYEGEIKYVVLNFPISAVHPFAEKAAEAAECAYDQGFFWEYHDLLFQNSQALGTDRLKGYAREIGMDSEAFDMCLDSGAKTERVLQDFRDGRSYSVTGTPTFFINGQALVGAQPFSSFQTVIDAALGR